MRHRPSDTRHVEDTRWQRDKRGNWRQKTDSITEVEFCHRATREPEGFYNGARVSGGRARARHA